VIVAAVSTSSNTVAVAALVVAALVGFGGPLIQSIAANKRQKKALEAAKDELDVRLAAESARLDQTLAAEHRRVRYESERDVLDAGAVFLQRFRAKLSQSAIGSPEIETMSDELGAQLARLRLWFAEESPVIETFQKMLVSCAAFAVQRNKGLTTDDLEAEIAQRRSEYLDAAREYLGTR
jgi:hypothetical protein